jgi:hypothetical protein
MSSEDFALQGAVQQTQKASSFKANPVVLDEKILIQILEKAL